MDVEERIARAAMFVEAIRAGRITYQQVETAVQQWTDFASGAEMADILVRVRDAMSDTPKN